MENASFDDLLQALQSAYVDAQDSLKKKRQEVLERRTITSDLPYDLEEPGDEGEITRGLMRLSQQALSKYVDKEPDIY